MDAEQIKKKKQEIVDRFGPWTAHCIHLANGVYTFDHAEVDPRLRRMLQICSDIVLKPLNNTRVLDLACLEGHFGIEFAMHGCDVLALEGRESNLAKARFVKELLGLNNLVLACEDVRNLDESRHGYFDVVLCLGILYHLDTPDVMKFIEKISQVCTRVAIIDTHLSLCGEESYTWRGTAYWGTYGVEHDASATAEQKASKVWYSLDNTKSFKFTRPSLCNLLRHVGFTSVYECLNPYEYANPRWPLAAEDDRHVIMKDRITLVAVKGTNETLLSSPVTQASPEIDRPEKSEYWEDSGMPIVSQTPIKKSLWSSTVKFMPKALKRAFRKVIVGRAGRS